MHTAGGVRVWLGGVAGEGQYYSTLLRSRFVGNGLIYFLLRNSSLSFELVSPVRSTCELSGIRERLIK
jgi:hypothetical protein